MRLLVIPVTSPPYEVDEPDYLQTFQRIVNGRIELVPIPGTPNSPPATLYCNEEGKLRHFPVNQAATDLCTNLDVGLHPTDLIVGTVVVCGCPDSEGNNTPVPQALIDSAQLCWDLLYPKL